MWRAGRQNVLRVTEGKEMFFSKEAYPPDRKGDDWQCSKLTLVLQKPGENRHTSIRLTAFLELVRMSLSPPTCTDVTTVLAFSWAA